jgi:hypothetical protein
MAEHAHPTLVIENSKCMQQQQQQPSTSWEMEAYRSDVTNCKLTPSDVFTVACSPDSLMGVSRTAHLFLTITPWIARLGLGRDYGYCKTSVFFVRTVGGLQYLPPQTFPRVMNRNVAAEAATPVTDSYDY